jgi:poly(hydroxyalkanoate) granule-associated protein
MTISESKTDAPTPAGWPLWQPPPGLPEPARQVWLAGLGALARAQAEGGKAFEALVCQGLALQTQANQVAQQQIAHAAQAATQHLDGLSGIFEDRVARALTHMGLPTAQDWAAWQARLQTLEITLRDVLRAAPTAAPQPSAAQPPVRLPAHVPAPSSVTTSRHIPQTLARAKGKPTPRASSGKKTRTPPSP